MAATTTPVSKPALVGQLRATWRASTEHFVEQVQRFVRLTILAAIPSVTNLLAGGKFDWRTLLAFILPFAEVAWRQVSPALGAAKVDTAPGATIVPGEVGDAVKDKGYSLVELLVAAFFAVLLLIAIVVLVHHV